MCKDCSYRHQKNPLFWAKKAINRRQSTLATLGNIVKRKLSGEKNAVAPWFQALEAFHRLLAFLTLKDGITCKASSLE